MSDIVPFKSHFSNHNRDQFQDAVDALHRLGCQPKVRGDQGTACCPCHEADGGSHDPSLTFRRGDKQSFVVHCHAGCDSRDILGALGISGAPRAKSETESDRIKREARQQKAEQAQIRKHQSASQTAQAILDRSAIPADDSHPYLQRKSVRAYQIGRAHV